MQSSLSMLPYSNLPQSKIFFLFLLALCRTDSFKTTETSMANLTNGLKHFLFMRVHFSECANLCQIDILSISECDYLVKCKNQRKRLRYDFRLLNILAVFRNLLQSKHMILILKIFNSDEHKRLENYKTRKMVTY